MLVADGLGAFIFFSNPQNETPLQTLYLRYRSIFCSMGVGFLCLNPCFNVFQKNLQTFYLDFETLYLDFKLHCDYNENISFYVTVLVTSFS